MNVDSSSICPSCHRLGRPSRALSHRFLRHRPGALRHRAPSAIVWADFASSGIIIRLPIGRAPPLQQFVNSFAPPTTPFVEWFGRRRARPLARFIADSFGRHCARLLQ
jgi:hypothetical protein